MEKMQDFLVMQQLYRSAIREITTKLEILDDEFRVRYAHNPIHHIESRLKSLPSILEKMQRKGIRDQDLAAIRRELTDIAGVRVICNYLHDIYRIRDLLVAQDDMCLQREKDYIKAPKENGYRSLHLDIEIPVYLSEHTEYVSVEVQLRTVAMDFWASLEHDLRYKSDKNIPEGICAEMLECAAQISDIDLKMQDIYKRIQEI